MTGPGGSSGRTQPGIYNNFYEFGTEKDEPSQMARNFRTSPWTVAVEGECAKKAVWKLEDILKGRTLEDRTYRHRCVEAWSMVIPWAKRLKCPCWHNRPHRWSRDC